MTTMWPTSISRTGTGTRWCRDLTSPWDKVEERRAAPVKDGPVYFAAPYDPVRVSHPWEAKVGAGADAGLLGSAKHSVTPPRRSLVLRGRPPPF